MPRRGSEQDTPGGDRYMRLADLAHYSTLSVQTLKRCLRHPTCPLPSHRFGRLLMVKRSDYDRWLVEQAAPRPALVRPAGLSFVETVAYDLAGYPRLAGEVIVRPRRDSVPRPKKVECE